MITWLVQQIRLLYKLITSNDSPRQMAVAAAFGLLLGVVPKGNLLAVAISVLFLSMRVHLATAMVVALCATFAAAGLDRLFHSIGHSVLTIPSLQEPFARLYQLPFVPWTAFNNTVVCGSVLFGAAAFYPTYRLSLPAFERWHRWKRGERANAARANNDRARTEQLTRDLSSPDHASHAPKTLGGAVELRLDPPHNRAMSEPATPDSVPQRAPSRPHRAAGDLRLSAARETLQRRRFRQFVAELESISRRVA